MTLIPFSDVSAEQKIVRCPNCGAQRNVQTAPECPVCIYGKEKAETQKEAAKARRENRKRYRKDLKKK